MHYIVVDLSGAWKWRWKCTCGEKGLPVRSIKDANSAGLDHEADMMIRSRLTPTTRF